MRFQGGDVRTRNISRRNDYKEGPTRLAEMRPECRLQGQGTAASTRPGSCRADPPSGRRDASQPCSRMQREKAGQTRQEGCPKRWHRRQNKMSTGKGWSAQGLAQNSSRTDFNAPSRSLSKREQLERPSPKNQLFGRSGTLQRVRERHGGSAHAAANCGCSQRG